MTVKSKEEKLRDALPECREVWAWLRKQPEYKQDFARLAETDEYKAHKTGKKLLVGGNLLRLREKWKFFPLVDPKENHNGYLVEALSIMGENPHVSYLTINGGGEWLMSWKWDEKIKRFVDTQGRKFKDLPNLPERILATFDPRLPLGTLTAEFERKVKHIQNLYSIKSKRIRYDGFKTLYITQIGRQFDWSQARIRREIRGIDVDNPRQDGQAEAYRHRVKRATKKVGV